eukprot:gnl/MRDRNA2_/MRDRNA2_179835_c0_seq1.p1 gnl/MRDRNA2_/MRDRNA2_179835_c0~~gnl/MRDRNA2_/MRDRNA2_179835_c0_seq1.p1  ORF type:complete len:492 (-),score=96.81 gnl/MRDRNA2_/MRDRNA2_179835_c0_seq1:406-1881(-)
MTKVKLWSNDVKTWADPDGIILHDHLNPQDIAELQKQCHKEMQPVYGRLAELEAKNDEYKQRLEHMQEQLGMAGMLSRRGSMAPPENDDQSNDRLNPYKGLAEGLTRLQHQPDDPRRSSTLNTRKTGKRLTAPNISLSAPISVSADNDQAEDSPAISMPVPRSPCSPCLDGPLFPGVEVDKPSPGEVFMANSSQLEGQSLEELGTICPPPEKEESKPIVPVINKDLPPANGASKGRSLKPANAPAPQLCSTPIPPCPRDEAPRKSSKDKKRSSQLMMPAAQGPQLMTFTPNPQMCSTPVPRTEAKSVPLAERESNKEQQLQKEIQDLRKKLEASDVKRRQAELQLKVIKTKPRGQHVAVQTEALYVDHLQLPRRASQDTTESEISMLSAATPSYPRMSPSQSPRSGMKSILPVLPGARPRRRSSSTFDSLKDKMNSMMQSVRNLSGNTQPGEPIQTVDPCGDPLLEKLEKTIEPELRKHRQILDLKSRSKG